MAEVVGAFAVSHIMFNSFRADEPELIYEGYSEIGRRVQAANPDVVLMISGDHLLNLGGGIHIPFAVGVSDSWEPFGDMGVPVRERPGHRDFAEGLASFLAENRVDAARLESEAFRPDHGYMCPMLFNDPDHELPFVPFHVSGSLEPVPSLSRCIEVAELIGQFVREVRPAGERVVIEGTGGLSHWLMMEGHGEVAEDFDNWVLQQFESGNIGALRALTNAEIFEKSGNGGLEVLYWIMAAVAAGPVDSADRIFYQPEWDTGLSAIELKLAS